MPISVDPVDARTVAGLARYAAAVAGAAAGPPVVLSHRTGELVVRCGAVVVKAHAADTAVGPRLALLDLPGVDELMLTPLDRTRIDGRDVTAWPAGVALRPDEAYDAPWVAAGTLLARLHATPLPAGQLPGYGGPGKVDRAMRRLAASPAWTGRRAAAVRAAHQTLPQWAQGGPRAGGVWTEERSDEVRRRLKGRGAHADGTDEQELDTALLRALLTESPLGVQVLDPELRVVRLNLAAPGAQGAVGEEAIGRLAREVAPGVVDDAAEQTSDRCWRPVSR